MVIHRTTVKVKICKRFIRILRARRYLLEIYFFLVVNISFRYTVDSTNITVMSLVMFTFTVCSNTSADLSLLDSIQHELHAI